MMNKYVLLAWVEAVQAILIISIIIISVLANNYWLLLLLLCCSVEEIEKKIFDSKWKN